MTLRLLSTSLRPPFSRLPARRGDLVLVCRGAVPMAAEKDGRYEPRWHLASWKRRQPHDQGKIVDLAAARDGWSFVVGGEIVRRQHAYVRHCGTWRRYPAQEIQYGAVTCKRCLALLRKKATKARRKPCRTR